MFVKGMSESSDGVRVGSVSGLTIVGEICPDGHCVDSVPAYELSPDCRYLLVQSLPSVNCKRVVCICPACSHRSRFMAGLDKFYGISDSDCLLLRCPGCEARLVVLGVIVRSCLRVCYVVRG